MTTAATTPAAAVGIDRFGGATMGTSWSVCLADGGHDLRRMHGHVQACLDEIVAQMSHWDAGSDLVRFNRSDAGWIALPEALLDVLACALHVAEASDGAFDPTLGELAARWGFGPSGPVAAPPDAAGLERARGHAGWWRLSLDRPGGRALQPGGLQLDLSAIAKGYAVDRVCSRLKDAHIDHALVEVGGELRATGRKPDGSAWRVLVETAYESDDDDSPAEVVMLDGQAIATSGDRWHRFRHAGTDYAHQLDPRSGAPLRHAPVAATVVMDEAMHADAWATALSVLAPEAALALACKRDIALRLVRRCHDGLEILRTPAFQRVLTGES